VKPLLRRIGQFGWALTAAQVGLLVHEHWQSIPSAQRRRFAELVFATKGNPRKLSPTERSELRAIARELNLPGLARRAARTAALGTRRGQK
jgi:hypothetical protein